jgi:iron complex outermembrane receptor protein
MNLGGQKAAGIDVTANCLPENQLRHFKVRLDGTYLTQFDNQLEKDSAWMSNIGRFGWPATAPPAASRSSPIAGSTPALNWNERRLGRPADPELQHQVPRPEPGGPAVLPRHLLDSLWNLTTTYTGIKQVKITAGVTNLFDKAPPVTNNTVYS